jgi:predicted ATPase
MYKRLELRNFKAFRELDLELRPLTLLSGMNGMGKSSVLQSLLLLRQSYLQRGSVLSENGQLNLILNGELVELGTGQDIFFDRVDYRPDVLELRFALQEENIGKHVWVYEYDAFAADVLTSKTPPETNSATFYETCLFQNNFHYLQAERIGPRTAFSMSDHRVRQHRQLGRGGEFTAHFLDVWRSDTVERPVRHPNNGADGLLNQVTAWMGEISPETQLEIKPHADMDVMSVRIGFPGTRSFRSTNVGFGITYTLPVLVALLSARPGYMVLLENPEAHLHPRGQSMMGELIARVASAGVQVIVETHSDHIMNGIRVAVTQKLIAPEQVAFHFFQRDKGSQDVEVETLELDNEGRLDYWPKNFFDEWKTNLDRLLYGGG